MERFAGPFLSPNQAGLEIAITAVACVVIAEWSWRTRNRQFGADLPRVLALAAALPLFITAACGLAATQSRAGWLAFAAALVVSRVWGGPSWRWVAGSGLVVAAAIAFWPGSTGRLTGVASELDSGERLILWKGALGIIDDHPWGGVGADCAALLESWYLPPAYTGRFSTALNDSLTCAAHFGIPALVLAATALATLVVLSWRARGSPLAVLGIAVLVAHLVAGNFQAHLFTTLPLVTAGVGLGLLVAGTVRGTPGREAWRVAARNALAWGVLAGLALGGLVMVLASTVPVDLPWRVRALGPLTFACDRSAQWRAGTALLLVDDKADALRVRRSLAEVLRRAGWEMVICRGMDPATALSGCGDARLVPNLLISWHEAALLTWEASRRGRIGIPAVAWDPTGIAGSARSGLAPLMIFATLHGPFVPDFEDLTAAQQRAGAGEELLPVTRGARSTDTWGQIERWLRARQAPVHVDPL